MLLTVIEKVYMDNDFFARLQYPIEFAISWHNKIDNIDFWGN